MVFCWTLRHDCEFFYDVVVVGGVVDGCFCSERVNRKQSAQADSDDSRIFSARLRGFPKSHHALGKLHSWKSTERPRTFLNPVQQLV